MTQTPSISTLACTQAAKQLEDLARICSECGEPEGKHCYMDDACPLHEGFYSKSQAFVLAEEEITLILNASVFEPLHEERK